MQLYGGRPVRDEDLIKLNPEMSYTEAVQLIHSHIMDLDI
jgi:hypothetical protein